MRWLQDRPRSSRYGISGFVLLAILWVIFVLPLYKCPCESRSRTIPLPPPTEDRFEFRLAWCRMCEGGGRITMYDHWRVTLASP